MLATLAAISPVLWPSLLLLLVVILILTGRLVTRRVLQDVRADRDVRVAEAYATAAVWRQAYEVSEQARAESLETIACLIERIARD